MSNQEHIEEELDQDSKQKLTDWKNEPSFDDLYTDYKMAQEDHGHLLTQLDIWEENMDGGPSLKNLAPGKSRVRPKLIRKQAEWKYPALEEPFLNTEEMFRIKPRTFEDRPAAEQNELVINYQWTTHVNKVELVGDIVRCVVDEGTVIVKTGWKVVEDTELIDVEKPVYGTPEQSLKIMQRMVETGRMTPDQMMAQMQAGEPMQIGTKMVQEEKIILTRNHPTYEVCDLRDVILDPTAKGVAENLEFVIHRYETDMATLKEQEFKEKIYDDEETGEEISETSGTYHNLKRIKVADGSDDAYVDYNVDGSHRDTNFKFKDKPRKKLEAYEYWGYWDIHGDGTVVSIIATWIEKTLVRLEENPFPFDGLPFSIAKYMPIKNEVYGEPDGELLIENQESVGKMMRAAHDITSTQAVGQEFINEQFFAGPSQKDNYKKGETVYFRDGYDPKTSIHKQSVDAVPNTVFQMIEYHQNDAESMSGTKSFSQGIGSQSMGSVASANRSALDASAKRELSILRRLSEQLFKDIAMKAIVMNQAFLQEEEIVRITNEEFVTIRREDLKGEFDLIVDVSTPEKDNEKAEKLNMLMQTNSASMHPGLAKIIYARIAKLWKEPDLAKEVEEFEPQPDPAEDELKKMQIENEMLKNQKLKMEITRLAKDIESEDSKIEERESRTAQNLISEVDENKASTRLKNAQANALEQTADLDKLTFVKTADGSARQEAIDDKEAQWMNDQELEQLRQKHKEELDAIKHQMKERESELKNRSSEFTAKMNVEKDLSIADIKAKEMGERAMNKMKDNKSAGGI